jgi:exodeoxyribonuclease-3
MKIISYNVNGIRAAINKGFLEWLQYENPDIICLQETKAQKEQLNTSVFTELGYHQYWFSAQKKGYSSVAIFTKIEPIKVHYGIGIEKFDFEGRFLRADFNNFTIIDSYFPSGTTGGERQEYKMDYLLHVKKYVDELQKNTKNIILCGDYNICHKPIDINHPERHNGVSGFLPEEREWLTNFLDSGFIDSFRMFDTSAEKYSWWSYRAGSRQKNLGWRIDYHIISNSLKDKITNAYILNKVEHSDHCPVVVEIKD